MQVNEVTDYLIDLKEVLDQFYDDTCRDLGGLERGINLLKINEANIKNNKTPLTIEIKKLSFDIPNIHKHSLPQNIRNSTLILSISIKFKESTFNFKEISDLNLNIEIEAMDEDGQPLKSAWHLDYHNVKGNEKFSHPQFHFQFGGQKIRESNQIENTAFNTGELFLMETPRLVHPPLDPVLAIDFVFGNFLGDRIWKKLRAIPKYRSIHSKSKDLLWKPYFEILSGSFTQPNDGGLAKQLNPGL